MAKMMKSSTLRWSFGSIHWSGLKVPPVPSPRGITQAIRLVRSETSNVSIFRAPLSLLRMRFHVVSTPQPSGDTMPRPVTTTRLISSTPAHDWRPTTRNRWTARPRPGRLRQHRAGASAFRVLFKKFCGVADGQNRLRRVVGNFATEFFFKRHHELDGIEAVGAEVVNEARVVDHFFGLNTKVFDHDLLNSLANLTHRSTSCLFPLDPTPRRSEPSWSLNFPSQSRIVLIWPRHSRREPGERRQAPHRQYTGFQIPARRSLPIRWWFGYHTSQALTISLDRPSETAFGPTWGTATGSNHDHSAIDVNRLPGDIGRLVGAEIDCRRSDIFRHSEPRCRDLRKDGIALLVVERVGHRRLDKSRRDAIGGDVALGIFRTQRLDHADQPRLRRRVIALTRIAGDADDGGDRDDAAEPLAHHQPGHCPGQAEGRRQIDLDDLVPVLVAQLHEQIVAGDAGIGDENIDLAHGLFRRRHQRLDLGGVGEIAGQHVNPVAELAGERV